MYVCVSAVCVVVVGVCLSAVCASLAYPFWASLRIVYCFVANTDIHTRTNTALFANKMQSDMDTLRRL